MTRRVYVQTFGCQMNVHDSERIVDLLRPHGFSPATEPEGADLVVLNTCSVREKAEGKLYSSLGALRREKERRPDMVIAVAGCVAQQAGEKILEDASFVDLVLGPDSYPELPAAIERIRDGGPPEALVEFDVATPRFLAQDPARAGTRPTAFVTVMKGCNERCTFCIVPQTRGPERYRPAGEILEEAGRLVGAGVREILLLGQTVNSYHDGETSFADLLARLDACAGLERLRYTSPHPRFFTPDLVAAHGRLRTLCEHVHLPAQSGSDRVLRRMLRRYTRRDYLAIVAGLRRAQPAGAISTDLIVGFPGETDSDFEETLSLVEEVRYLSAFSFKFSPRPGTPALRLPDDVPAAEKQRRLAALQALQGGISQRALAGRVGDRVEVLVEGAAKKGNLSTGRTRRNEIVNFSGGTARAGDLATVTIVRAGPHSLEGRVGPTAAEAGADARPCA